MHGEAGQARGANEQEQEAEARSPFSSREEMMLRRRTMDVARRKALKTLSLSLAAAAALGLQGFAGAQAQNYPTKQIQLIVPYEAGASIDNVGRKVAEGLTKRLGQPVVIEYRPGGGGVVGTERAARSKPDGYTLMIQNSSFLTQMIVEKVPYEMKSFSPVSKLASTTQGLVVYSKVEANSVKELIELAKKEPNKLLASTTAVGASAHLATEWFKEAAGIDIKIVNFSGSAQALTDVLGGHSQIMMSGVVNLLPHIKAGRLKVLATTGAKRAPFLPEVPTVAETVPGFVNENWWGIFAPAGVPAPILARLSTEIKAVMEDPEMLKWLESQGAVNDFQTADEFAADLDKEYARWADIVKRAGIAAEGKK
jgi:tripartite-type tricarboxylate transporter receptor subunit TctC